MSVTVSRETCSRPRRLGRLASNRIETCRVRDPLRMHRVGLVQALHHRGFSTQLSHPRDSYRWPRRRLQGAWIGQPGPMAYMYILECSDRTPYVGSARNLEHRLAQHGDPSTRERDCR
ncbi:GIY-YIG nuclease family protein [Microbacterium sp. CFH 31415]|uniref:GIY-YIG nuclease family protein n=1 Tax=Microbacterium sp. CFH 31415 TaxID=2921732 RepID=UPI0035ABA4D9